MYVYLKNLTATQQVGVMFVILFGLLLLASLALFVLSLREPGDAHDAADRKSVV